MTHIFAHRFVVVLVAGILIPVAGSSAFATTTTITTTTTVPSDAFKSDGASERRGESMSDTLAVTTTTMPFVPKGTCSVRFVLEKGSDWVGLRFVAAYDRHKGRFAGKSNNVACSWSKSFDSVLVENYYGVLQVAAMNDASFELVTGPIELLVCDFEYAADGPAVDNFLLKVHSAKTIVPIVMPNEQPNVSVTIDCSRN